MKMNVRKGDKVVVLAGKDKGKQGVVLRGLPAEQRVVVEGINLIKKAQRPTQANPQGGIITKEAPLHVSNVMVVCPKCGKPSRMGKKRVDDGTGKLRRVRVCKKCGADID